MTTADSFTAQLRSFAHLFWTPSRAIDEFAEMKSPWAIQWLLVLIQLTLLAITYQFTLEVSIRLLPENLPEETYAALLSRFHWMSFFTALFSVLALFLRWYLTAALLYVVAILLTPRDVPFRRFFGVAVLASVFVLIEQIQLVSILLLRGPHSFQRMVDLDVPTGLNLLPFDFPPLWWRVLGAFNLPELLMVGFLGWALCRLAQGVKPLAAYASVSALWITWVLLRSLSSAGL